jgi:hypothetical protein
MRSHSVIRPTAAVFLCAWLAAAFAGPALAGSDQSATAPSAIQRPDASIETLTSHYSIPGYTKFPWYYESVWHGVGVYNTTGANQTAAADWQYGCCNEKHAFSISIRNKGKAADHFKVRATGSGLVGWTVTYFKGTTNITSAVVAGTYQTPLVAAGSQVVLTARLTGNAATETFAGYRLITLTSVAASTNKDAVRLQLHEATWCHC